jgi:glutamine synthetase
MQPCKVANSGLLMRAAEQKGAGQAAAIHAGIQQQIDPGAAITGNGYAQAKDFLPTDWLTALRALKQSAWAKEQLGGELLKVFLAIKHREYREFMGEVGEQDWRWYLTHA